MRRFSISLFLIMSCLFFSGSALGQIYSIGVSGGYAPTPAMDQGDGYSIAMDAKARLHRLFCMRIKIGAIHLGDAHFSFGDRSGSRIETASLDFIYGKFAERPGEFQGYCFLGFTHFTIRRDFDKILKNHNGELGGGMSYCPAKSIHITVEALFHNNEYSRGELLLGVHYRFKLWGHSDEK
ncbi:MAG: hypothetical protein R3F48_03155 [Candidatus Zixiibacteriota bacterium]